jgi:hypothetical protein
MFEEMIVWALSLGVPLFVTNWLMENSPFLQAKATWIVWMEQFIPAKFTRRGLSLLIPLLVSAGVVAAAVFVEALPTPVDADAWLYLIYDYSGIAVILPQLWDAIRAKPAQ